MSRKRFVLIILLAVGVLSGALALATVGLPGSVMAEAPAGCPDGMMHYWRLDEASSGAYADSYGTSHGACAPGKSCPAPTTEGKVGGAQVFASGTGVDVLDDDTFDWGVDESFTVEFWMYRPGSISGNEVIIGRQGPTHPNPHIWIGVLSSGVANFSLYASSGDSASLAGTLDLTQGGWHHFVAVRDAGADQLRLYIDGKQEGSVDHTYGTGFETTTELNIGWLDLGGGYHYQGWLDEVAIYSRVLTEMEIKARYYLTRGYCELCETPVRIMPLGDSITVGNASGVVPDDAAHWVSYRKDLWESLGAAGYVIDFVGGEKHGDAFDPPFDSDHEGHGGWTDSQIRDNVIGFLTANPADVVLLHIGTNGLNPDPDQVREILDNIDTVSEDITVILARIINRECCTDSSPCGECETTTIFNGNVGTMAKERIDSGDKIIIVDMEDGAGIDYRLYPTGDMNDNLHPYATGYSKMAVVWHDALDDFLPVCATASVEAPTITSEPVTQATVGSPYSYDVDADGDPIPTYGLTENPSGMTINGTTGVISWTPTTGGAYDVTVQASNTAGMDEQTFTLYVADVTTCPAETIAYYPLDESSAPYVDSFGGPDGTCTNCPASATGTVAGAQEFDGGDDGVNVADADQFEWAATDEFSVEYWMKSTSNCDGNEVIVGRDDASSSLHWWTGCAATGDEALFVLLDKNGGNGGNGNWAFSGMDITNGDWHHLTFVKDATHIRVYVDGVERDSVAKSYTAGFDGAVPLNIGYLNLSGYYRYQGLLDEVAIHGRALSATEVEQHYVNGLAGHEYCEPPVIPDPEVENLSLTSTSGSDLTTDDLTCNYNLAGSATTAATAWEGNSADLMSLYLPMEGGSVNSMLDFSGSGNHGTAGGDPAWVATGGFDGNGYFDLDGNDYIDAGDAMPADAAYTKVAWVYWIPGNNMNNIISGEKHPGHAFWVTQYPENSGVYLSAGHQDPWREVKDASEFPASEWVHVAVTYDPAGSGTMVLYRDGVEVDRSTSVTPNNTNGDTQAYVGTYNGSVHFKGYIDDARIYTRALSGEQVAALYDGGAGTANVIVSEETVVGDDWQCHVTPFSTSDAGATYPSNVLAIVPAGGAPVITSAPVTSAMVGEPYAYDVDADGDPAPTYALTEKPSGMTINGATGLISWTPAAGGAFDVTVEASNSAGTESQAFTIYVADVTTCPAETIAYYPLNESSAPYADLFGGPDATCTNCPASATGIVGGAQQFNGTDDEVTVADDDSLDWTADASFTVEYWMKKGTACSGNEVIVGRDDSSSSLHWWTGCDDNGTVRFNLNDTNGNGPYIGGTGDVINDGKWHHLAFVRDESADENRIYVDGVETHSATHDYTAGFGGSVPLDIGHLNLGGRYRYDGLLDEVAFHDRALDTAEIEQHHINGMAGHGYCEPSAETGSIEVIKDTDPAGGTGFGFSGDLGSFSLDDGGSQLFADHLVGDYDVIEDAPAGWVLANVDCIGGDSDLIEDGVTIHLEPDEDIVCTFRNEELTVPACPAETISYYPLDESAPPYADLFGGPDATCANCPVAVAGIVSGAQQFSNDQVLVPDDDTFDWASGDSFSIEFWMRRDGAFHQVVIGRDDPSTDLHWWSGTWGDGTGAFVLRDTSGDGGAFLYGTTNLGDNQWHHVVAVRDAGAGENRLYVDGSLEDAEPASHSAGFGSGVPIELGTLLAGYFYTGLVDEVALYDRALSHSEVELHHDLGRAGLPYCSRQPEPPTIVSTPGAQAFLGVPYQYDVEATGYPVPSYALTEKPSGMIIDEITGLISWTPGAAGDFDVTVTATNSEGTDTQDFVISVVEPGPCPPDISAYWRLDETTGGSYDDYVNPDDEGECATSMPERTCPVPVAGTINGAQRFTREDQTGVDVPVPTAPAEDAPFDWSQNASFTIEFWAKGVPGVTCAGSGVSNNEVIVGRDDDHVLHWWFGCANTTGNAHFQLGSRNAGSGDWLVLEGPPINDGSWHHLVGVRDGINGINRLYVDGVEVASESHAYTAGFESDSAPLNLGWLNLTDGYHFTGELDEVALYDRVLSEYEIQMHNYLGRGYCDACVSPVLIMPLGDSITVGNASGVVPDDAAHWVSYRKDLWESLGAAGYAVDFVGGQTHGDAFDPPFDSDHEGHGGWTDSQIRDNVISFLTTNPADVVLLHIGTNGLNPDPDQVGEILDNIDTVSEDITVILARIINRECCTDSSPCGECETTTIFNGNVGTMAKERIDSGDKIIIVDMEDGAGIDYRLYPTGDMNDNLHPYATGYAKMSGVWHAALASFLPVCGPSVPCYGLTLGHTGQGSDPVASPTHSAGCPTGQYTADEYVELGGAVPDAGWQIAGWTGTDDDASTAGTNSLTMPADAHSAGVTYTELAPTCYALTLGHTGQGGDPVASPIQSIGCPEGEYLGGEYVELSGAVPDTGWQIGSWSGTGDDSSTSDTNWLLMPAAAHSASVNYTLIPLAAIEVVKTADPTTIFSGELVTYNYLVTNIGDAILSNVTLTDDKLGDIPLASSRVTDDLVALYTFGEGSGASVLDVSGVGSPMDLTVADPDNVSWILGGGLSVDSATIVESAESATKVIDACQSSNEIAIEAWVKPANTTQDGPARIVSLSDGTLLRNFTLAQAGGSYDVRLRTTATSDNGIPSLAAGTVSTDLTHVVYTRGTAGVGRLYVNGVEADTLTVLTGTFSNWDADFRFGLANEFGAGREWLGQYHLVAIYNRALTSEEVTQNYEARVGAVTLLPDESVEVSVSATLYEDTTNTATATGTPPVGDSVSDSDAASVVVETVNSITIVKEAEPGGATGFEFLGDLGSFSLDAGRSEVFRNLEIGDYEVTEVVPDGWVLAGVLCTGGDSDLTDDGVIIHLDPGESITCTFTNEAAGLMRHLYYLPLGCCE